MMNNSQLVHQPQYQYKPTHEFKAAVYTMTMEQIEAPAPAPAHTATANSASSSAGGSSMSWLQHNVQCVNCLIALINRICMI